MSKKDRKLIQVSPGISALQSAFVDLALFLIDQGVTAAELQNTLSSAFVAAAMKRARMKNGRVNQSGVAIMTGLTRTEVRKLLRRTTTAPVRNDLYGARKVIDGWARDPEFTTRDGKPKLLSMGGGYGSFARLARRYSGDIPPKATLDELRRIKAVSISRDGIRLRREGQTESTRRSRSLTQAAVQLSTLFRLMGYPEAGQPAVALYDGIVVDVEDKAGLRITERRIEQSARAFLSGLEASVRDLTRQNKPKEKPGKRQIVVNVAVSSFSPKV